MLHGLLFPCCFYRRGPTTTKPSAYMRLPAFVPVLNCLGRWRPPCELHYFLCFCCCRRGAPRTAQPRGRRSGNRSPCSYSKLRVTRSDPYALQKEREREREPQHAHSSQSSRGQTQAKPTRIAGATVEAGGTIGNMKGGRTPHAGQTGKRFKAAVQHVFDMKGMTKPDEKTWKEVAWWVE